MVEPKDYFSDLLGTIEGEQERQSILATITKTDDGKKFLAKINALATDGENYRTWHQTDWPTFKAAKETLDTVQAELTTTKQELEKLKTKGATTPTPTPETAEEFDMENMTQEQLNKILDDRIRAMGFVTKSEADTIAETRAREAAAGVTNKVYTHALPLVEIKLAAKRQYETDFPGKRFDDSGFEKFMGDNPGKFPTIQDALGAFTKTDYENKTKADAFEQGRIAGEKTERERLEKQYADQAARGLPVDMGGGNGMPDMPGASAPEPVELDKVPQDYEIGRRGGFRLAAGIAAKVKQDRSAGKLAGQ